MTLTTTRVVRETQVRVPEAEAWNALDKTLGLDLQAAMWKLRHGPGRTCEAVARVLDRAIAETKAAGLEPEGLIVTAAKVAADEDIVRVRRKAHGKADWITSVTSDVTVELTPRGLHLSAGGRVESGERPAPAVAPREHTFDPADQRAEVVHERLYDVIDPDLGINLVDLGFVREVVVTPEGVAVITMTLTSAACPLTEVMADQIRAELLDKDDSPVNDFRIEWEWLPPWTPSDITSDGREQLQAIGFTI
jgi:metal-sulfur cluster biosynthetic enzyme/ribosomal protein L22